MSKRHQASRRKSYGRRQHEVHERYLRQRDHAFFDARVDELATDRLEAFGLEIDASSRAFSYSPVD